MSRWITPFVAALLGCLIALPAAAQWKWRDKTGQTQYSDLPPPAGVADRDILQRPNAPQERVKPTAAAASAAASGASAAPPLAAKTTEPELEAKRRKAEQDEAAKHKAELERVARAKADNCVRAREQMRTLDSGIRIARTNAKGEREVLDDAARAAEVRRTQDIVASDCR
ncbi:MAG: DUF4124 domain-containing protein [Burkholderiaceae bacterium]